MTGVLEELGRAISGSTALKLASSLEIDGSVSRAAAAAKLPETSASLLRVAFEAVGAVALADLLRGFAAAARANTIDIRAVWSGPTFHGDGDHTTAALAHLVDEATEEVFASTFSATSDSLYMKALWRAVARGVKTTLLLDVTINQGSTAAWVQAELVGARFLGFKPDVGGGKQHSKVVIVDSRAALVTSANLSKPAHEKNLETGVIIRDPDFASSLRQRFSKLHMAGHLYDLP